MKEKTKLMLILARQHKSLEPAMRIKLAGWVRTKRKQGKQIGPQWSPLLGKLIFGAF